MHRFAQGRNLRADEAAQLHRLLEVQTIEHPEGLWGLSQAHWQALRAQVLGAAAAEHAEQPDRLGVSAAALGERLGRRSAAPTLRAALDSLVNEAVVVREGLRFRLATHRPELSAEDSALLERVAQLLRPAGLRPPIVGELATVLALAPPVLAEFLVRAGHLGQLVRVAPNRFFLPETVAELVRHARQLANETDRGDFDAAAYRDRTAIGRNLTVQVLEFMDREGLTRFDGARRKPLP